MSGASFRALAALLPALLLGTPAGVRAGDAVDGGSPPPAPAGFVWQAIPELSDEFDGDALDAGKWMPKHAYWNGRAPSVFAPTNVSVRDGMLRLRSTSNVATLEGVKDPEKDVWVQAACVSSRGPLASCGYYAARMKASALSMTSHKVPVLRHRGLPLGGPAGA